MDDQERRYRMSESYYLFEENPVDSVRAENIRALWESIAKNGSPFEKMKILADAYRDVDHWQTGEFIDWIIRNKRVPIRIKRAFASGWFWKFEVDKWTLGKRGKYCIPGEFQESVPNPNGHSPVVVTAGFRYLCYRNLIDDYFHLHEESRQKVLAIKYPN